MVFQSRKVDVVTVWVELLFDSSQFGWSFACDELFGFQDSSLLLYKVSPDWICAVTSRFTKLFYCKSPNIAHI